MTGRFQNREFRIASIVGAIALVLSICVQQIASAQESQQVEAGQDDIQPPDLAVRVALVRAELELIRFEMGRPGNDQPEIDVSNASARGVYFQALTLFRKANRLCFERTRRRVETPEIPAGEIESRHVLLIVDAVLDRIREVKRALDIRDGVDPIERDASQTNTDVFQSIVQANRQLNLLLERRFAPSDVFEQVTLSISYAAQLLALSPGAARISNPAPFERGKRPADVYDRLVACFDRIRQIEVASSKHCLSLNASSSELTTPSDVYDVASLIVAELAFLHNLVGSPGEVIEPYYPGVKFPSHVYQRVGILEKQLESLQSHTADNPDWLTAGNRSE